MTTRLKVEPVLITRELLAALVAGRHACLGPGPRGLTVTWPGKDLTEKLELREVAPGGVPNHLLYVKRSWEEVE